MGLGSRIGKLQDVNKNDVINGVYKAFYQIREHKDADYLVSVFSQKVKI